VQGNASGITVTGGAGRDVIQFNPTFAGFSDATIGGIGRRVKLDPTAIFHADGNAGNDVIEILTAGTPYGSTITGGDGDDKLLGGLGADSLSGNAGKDTIKGAEGNDRLAGNGGRDRLFGGIGDDRLYGGASGDWLYGEFGNDQLNGEGGDDRLYADDVHETEVDTLHGNAGNDQFVTKDGLVDQLFGDGGHDSALPDNDDVLTSIESLG
jgi:Ca2+-binding RTX toxin-like protein